MSERFSKELLLHLAEAEADVRRRWHLTRFQMYRQLEGKLGQYDSPEKTMLSVSRSRQLGVLMGLKQAQVEPADYPDRDITALDLPDDSVDYVIADQVLEHVADGPFAAFSECRRVTRPGGFIVMTTCLMNEIHQAPMDFWRFTPFGLRRLAERYDLEIFTDGAWGNREASAAIQQGFRKVMIPEDESHPLFRLATLNDEKHPIVTWLVARVPMAGA